MSQKPPISAPMPYEVPLVSRSKSAAGWFFLYSVMSRGASSSPIVFEPRMVIFPGGAVPGDRRLLARRTARDHHPEQNQTDVFQEAGDGRTRTLIA